MSSNLFVHRGNGNLDQRNIEITAARSAMNGEDKVFDLTPVAPMAVERLVTAQMNYYGNNNQNVRSRTLFHATPIGIGWALTLIARVLRVAVRTLGMPISLPVAAFQQGRYGEMKKQNSNENILKYNLVAEDIRRIGQEWADLGTTLLSAPIGVVNTVAPGAISTEFLYHYYADRTKQNVKRNKQFNKARSAYLAEKEAMQKSWERAQKGESSTPPVQTENLNNNNKSV